MALWLLNCAPGSLIRPMGAVAAMGIAASIGLFIGIPISIAGVYFSRREYKWLGCLAALLNLVVFPVGCVTMDVVATMLHLTFDT